MKEPIDNLEGPPPTTEERAAMARELDRVAPTPAKKFELMFGQRPTPRTDAAANESIVKVYETSKDIERELAEAREEGEEQARLLGMSGEREAGLLAEVDRLKREIFEVRDENASLHEAAFYLNARYRHLAARLHEVSVELNEARERRDRLAAALEACREDSCELLGERSWWKDEDRAGFSERYDATAENIVRADKALDSIKGGSCD
jgi:septal ring factor EnvC (AmiA/AmiB activator)